MGLSILIGILLLLLLLINFLNLYKNLKTKEEINYLLTIQSNKDKEEQEKLYQIQSEINILVQDKQQLTRDIENGTARRNALTQEIENQEKHLQQFHQHKEEEMAKKAEQVINKFNIFTQSTDKAYKEYEEVLEQQYVKVEQQFDEKVNSLKLQEQEVLSSLNKLKDSLSAGVQAQLREQEKQDKLGFYKLPISEQHLADIQVLNQIKHSLSQPVILNKLIWTTYFQKTTTELCNRILGINKICGIYKITNINTQQCYIGQSVDVAQRWKDHVKCGLGIDASATNKLYNNMQKDGVWNFSFELLEQCPRELLNEKEKFWINLYQSDKFGYNSTKGGS